MMGWSNIGGWAEGTGLFVTALVCVAALTFGGERERYGAVLCLAWRVLITAAAYLHLDTAWAHFAADALCLTGFVILGWKAPHPWPLWAGGFELAALAVDINRVSGYPAAAQAYAVLGTVCAFGVLASLAIATLKTTHRQVST